MDAMTPGYTLADLRERVGRELAVSPWLEVTQARIDAFAACTGDHQWIHVDAGRAAQTPLGGTIAHGFLLQSLAAGAMHDAVPLQGVGMAMVYGTDRLRFLAPVRAGQRVRASYVLGEWLSRDEGAQGRWNISVEQEGSGKVLVFDLRPLPGGRSA